MDIDRRKFLSRSARAAAALGAASLIAPRPARTAPASERVRLAAIGVGGRCRSLIRGFLDRDDSDIVTLCDVWPRRERLLDAAKEIEERRGERPRIVKDYRKVLDDPEVDAVIVATPDHWHAPLAVFACRAGKDVYVEKPPSHNVWEGRRMVEAAARHARVVQCGTQNRSAPYVRRAVELVRSGKIGDVRLVKVFNMKPGRPYRKGPGGKPREGMDYDTWLGPAPERPYNDRTVYGGGWHMYWDFSGGDMADDGVHQLDVARWLIGKGHPKAVHATGGNLAFDDDREVPDTQVVTFDYDRLVMTFELTQWTPYMRKTNGQIRRGKSFPYWPQNATRIELYGTKNRMVLGRHGGGWQVFTDDGKVVDEEYGRFPDDAHKEDFVAAVKSRRRPSAPPEEGHLSASLVHLANIAYRVGGKLEFDGVKERFADSRDGRSERGNALLKREYRERFAVPEAV